MNSTVARLNQEWLYSNLSKAYPLADSIGGSTIIPHQLLADAFVLVAGAEDGYCSARISKIITTATAVTFVMSVNVGDAEYDLGNVATFPLTSDLGAVISFDIDIENISVMGKIAIGDVSCCNDLPPVVSLDDTDGVLSVCCVRGITGVVTGLIVGGVRYSGDVTLEAGDGVTIVANSSDSGTSLVFSAVDYNPPSENSEIISDAQLVAEATSLYGVPICTINGVPADERGNIEIVGDGISATIDTPNTDEFKVQVASISDKTGSISITLSKELTCDIESTFTIIMENIAELQKRIAIIDEHITAVDNANTNLAMRLTTLR